MFPLHPLPFTHHHILYFKFSDDTTGLGILNVIAYQHSISHFTQWCTGNYFQLNMVKTKVLVISSPVARTKFWYCKFWKPQICYICFIRTKLSHIIHFWSDALHIACLWVPHLQEEGMVVEGHLGEMSSMFLQSWHNRTVPAVFLPTEARRWFSNRVCSDRSWYFELFQPWLGWRDVRSKKYPLRSPQEMRFGDFVATKPAILSQNRILY